MNPRHLRHGNFVYINDQISPIWAAGINALIQGYLHREVNPIPITPEILAKTNLRLDKREPYDETQFGVDPFSAPEESPFHLYWSGTQLTYNGWPIPHLHELQNLHLLLTNTELPFNP